MAPIRAVLTGDLIRSTRAGAAAVDAAMAALGAAAHRLSFWAGADTRFTRYRGDGWQIYLDAPGLVLRASLLMAASLRAAETGLATRLAVGLGTVERLGSTGLSDASGDAFAVSGHALDDLPRGSRLAIAGWHVVPPWQEAIFDLADWQSARWSREQAEAVALALDPAAPPLAELAAHLGITRQALQARLKGAGFGALEKALLAFESHDFKATAP